VKVQKSSNSYYISLLKPARNFAYHQI